MRSRLLALTFAGVALFAAGCGGDDDEESASAPPQTVVTPVPTPTKPKVEYDKKAPEPKKLESEDVKPGTGPAVKKGDAVSVHYVGVDFKTGKQFDSSYDSGQQFNLTIGAGDVIKGWDQGLVGMKVGGRRRLIIPPDLAYGKQGSPPSIKANATLVFYIDLIEKL